MKTYRPTSDSSAFYRAKTGDFGHWTAGSSECGLSVDVTKNNTVPAAVVYVLRNTVPAASTIDIKPLTDVGAQGLNPAA